LQLLLHPLLRHPQDVEPLQVAGEAAPLLLLQGAGVLLPLLLVGLLQGVAAEARQAFQVAPGTTAADLAPLQQLLST
jgi:hypothetical protein